MIYTKVREGDRLNIPAATYNAFVDAAQYVASQRGGKSPTSPDTYSFDKILIRNDSGADIERFRALAIRNPLTLPTDNLDDFKNRVVMSANTPAYGDENRWGITLEPIANGQLGEAVLSGVTIAWINLTTAGDKSVEMVAGSNVIKGGQVGLGTILWVAGGVGAATATGAQWAVIRIGDGNNLFPTGQYQFQNYTMVSQNRAGFDYSRCHPMF